ncbi:hypothetical protein FGADI_8480 [Fusarium gaditjirri]|uniref:Uncharacterized protein n=1 Tax=Fusarium gaditjirri TaxID=282569 RepID=A0A8H4T2B0_9HYPO|nr:hypothetical protein FGADI_8480 [Fusarium gaditjirri]
MNLLFAIGYFLSLPLSVTAFFGSTNDTDFWDDFANNFATDLAPIISLFGEQVTKQFLSESTTFLDTIVFAVGPLGILTGIVSCIRLCGGPFLKSLIGRAREPEGVPELEVCSSTSKNVCELLSRNGICRVFGTPKILEFIFEKPDDPKDFYPLMDTQYGHKSVACGIKSPKKLFKIMRSGDEEEAGQSVLTKSWVEIPKLPRSWESIPNPWEEVPPWAITILPSFVRRLWIQHTRSDWSDHFAPFPNLALNIGEHSLSGTICWLWLATVFGVLLQLSFFGYATWASWYHPKFYQEQSRSDTRLFFIFTVVGTTSVVLGMGFVARLIDRTSIERWFIYSTAKGNSDGQEYFWIQAAQSIGDQKFSAFAYQEMKKDYVTSWKNEKPDNKLKSSFMVWVAVGLSFFGWIIQFIGLRGQHGTISLYLLCSTICMSCIRAFIRSLRSSPKNQLGDLEDEVEGFELDWQALSLAKRFINGNPEESLCWFFDESRFGGCNNGARFEPFAVKEGNRIKYTMAVDEGGMEEQAKWGDPALGAITMRIRSELSCLAWQASLETWYTDARMTAQKLQEVLQEAAKLWDDSKVFSHSNIWAIVWSASCQCYQQSFPPNNRPITTSRIQNRYLWPWVEDFAVPFRVRLLLHNAALKEIAKGKDGSFVDSLADFLVSTGLATRDEAIMSIVPALCPD